MVVDFLVGCSVLDVSVLCGIWGGLDYELMFRVGSEVVFGEGK